MRGAMHALQAGAHFRQLPALWGRVHRCTVPLGGEVPDNGRRLHRGCGVHLDEGGCHGHGRRIRRGHLVEVWLGLRIGRLLVAGPLDLLPLHSHAELRTPAKEELMVVRACIRTLRESTEAVQVELPLEGRELGLSEVLGHDVLSEVLGLADQEGPAVRQPPDDVGVLAVQQLVQLFGERLRDAAGLLPHVRGRLRLVREVAVDVRHAPPPDGRRGGRPALLGRRGR
mmetsp:Transcript_5003/g.14562  ORF Transcript_5003/g.14562 Transcript_5003/m.14562 type:complete len:227 (+) Transcript_5003:1105-1785(+)